MYMLLKYWNPRSLTYISNTIYLNLNGFLNSFSLSVLRSNVIAKPEIYWYDPLRFAYRILESLLLVDVSSFYHVRLFPKQFVMKVWDILNDFEKKTLQSFKDWPFNYKNDHRVRYLFSTHFSLHFRFVQQYHYWLYSVEYRHLTLQQREILNLWFEESMHVTNLFQRCQELFH